MNPLPALQIVEIGPDGFRDIWPMVEAVARAGDSYSLPRDLDFNDARTIWAEKGRRTFIARESNAILGTYYLRAALLGPAAHIANAGFITAPAARGKGVARAMGEHALETARAAGFRAVQFNAVVSTNAAAVRAWTSLGFEIIGRVPEGYDHARDGLVDLLIMHRKL